MYNVFGRHILRCEESIVHDTMDHRFGNDEKTAVYDENIEIRVSLDLSVNSINSVHIIISI